MIMPSTLQGPVWRSQSGYAGPPLVTDERAEVCVVGAGVAGILTAERLAREGRSVVVVDRGPVGCGETGRSTAHTTSALDDRFYSLEKVHGAERAALAAESHAAAVDHLERLEGELGIDFEFRRLDGYLVVHGGLRDRARELLETERAACERAGVAGVERVERLPEGWPQREGGALRFPRQGQLNPTALVNGVARHLVGRGVRVYSGSHVAKIQGGDGAYVETREGAVVRCDHVVVATNTPINDRVVVHTKQAGYQTYAIAARVAGGGVAPALWWDGLWEEDEAYHYVRLAHGSGGSARVPEDDLLIIGGEDHKTGQDGHDAGRFIRLEEWARANFPFLGEVQHRWSGEVMEPADGLAFIGRNPLDHSNVYVVTGDSGNGITHGAIASMLLTDLIMGRPNRWAELYSPSRKVPTGALGEYARENLNTAAQYADWLRPGEVTSEEQIRPGTGAIITRGLRKVAVYRDDSGRCTRLSATCPHLGGVVRWNVEAGTWDCPCHGSRFSAEGDVIHGPAPHGLTPLVSTRPGADRADSREDDPAVEPNRAASES